MSGKRSATPERHAAGNARPVVLFDGWSLRGSNSAAPAMHLLELLESFPAGALACVALPFNLAPGNAAAFPQDVRFISEDVPHTPSGHLHWEQRMLPDIAVRVRASRIHSLTLSAPQFSPTPVIASPAADHPYATGFAARARSALGQGGLSQARAVLWPADLPFPRHQAAWRQVSPTAHSAFWQPQLPPGGAPGGEEGTYILIPGDLDENALQLLSAAWTWAAPGLDEECALVLCDMDGAKLDYLRSLCREGGTEAVVSALPGKTPAQRAALFQHARVVLLMKPPQPWGDDYLQALAAARPIVAEETPLAGARVGPAAYLVSAGDSRGLGAALITVTGEEDVEQQLITAARARSAVWDRQNLARVLREAYG